MNTTGVLVAVQLAAPPKPPYPTVGEKPPAYCGLVALLHILSSALEQVRACALVEAVIAAMLIAAMGSMAPNKRNTSEFQKCRYQ